MAELCRRRFLGTAVLGAGAAAVCTPGGEPTFVLVHGANGNAGSFAPLIAGLVKEGRRALAVDLPGHGPAGHFPPLLPGSAGPGRPGRGTVAARQAPLGRQRRARHRCRPPGRRTRTGRPGRAQHGRWRSAARLDAARILLEQTTLPVEAIATRVGLASAVNLRRRFRVHLGTTPGAYRRTFSQNR